MLVFKIDADEADLGKMVCCWEEDAAVMTIRGLLENWLLRKFFEFSGENEIQRALDALSMRALMLLEERAPRAFNRAQVELVAEIFMELTEETLAEFEDLSALKEVRKKMHATARRIYNERIGVNRGRKPGKSQRRKKKDLSEARKARILAAMREIGREPVHRKEVALKLGVSIKTIKIWVPTREEWEALIAEALSTGSRQ